MTLMADAKEEEYTFLFTCYLMLSELADQNPNPPFASEINLPNPFFCCQTVAILTPLSKLSFLLKLCLASGSGDGVWSLVPFLFNLTGEPPCMSLLVTS